MTKTVEKWAACFWCDRLHVAKGRFKKTAKQYRRESGSYDDDIAVALGQEDRFSNDTDLLHDTKEGALDALHSREMQVIQTLRDKIEKIQVRLDLIEAQS